MNKKWIFKAMVLGFSFFLAILIKKPIGVSTQFNVASGMVEYAINRDLITEEDGVYKSTNAYYNKSDGKLAKAIKNPLNYGFVFVLSIFLGSYIGHKLLSKKDKSLEPIDKNTTNNLKESPYLYFISGFILLFGARLAGGCTSGHMMSGIMQGAVSGFIFAGVVFFFGITSAIIKEKI